MNARPARGEVWWIALDPTVGSEVQKTRPCVVISADWLQSLPVRIVVPITSWKKKHGDRPWCIPIEPDAANGLDNRSAADALQVRCVSPSRFRNRMGQLAGESLEDVVLAVGLCVDAPSRPS